MLSIDTQKDTYSGCRGFLPIAVGTLCPTAGLDFDLYSRPDQASPVVLYRERSYPLDQDDIDRLVECGLTTLYIPSASHSLYQRFLREVVVHNESLAPTQRFQVLKAANRAVFETVFRADNTSRMIEYADETGKQITEIVCNQDLVVSDLLSLMDHDYYTYTHVTNVCTYSVVLASKLDDVDEEDLPAIAAGALLHDIGKRHIPPVVLNKPGRFNDEERNLVQQHPKAGFEELCMRGDLSWGQLMMVYQHHERIDGKGYPVQLEGEEIDEWARICTIADVFDALTSERPYRKATQVGNVLEFLEEWAGTHFDQEMVRCWNTMVRDKP